MLIRIFFIVNGTTAFGFTGHTLEKKKTARNSLEILKVFYDQRLFTIRMKLLCG